MSHSIHKAWVAISLLVTILIAIGCGGGGGTLAGGGIGGTGITAFGTITGFGSILVNGNKFEINGTTISDDDNPSASQDDLSIGMVVTVRTKDDGVTAESVIFDPEIEGPVSVVEDPNPDGTERIIEVLGTRIILSANGTVYDDGPNSTITFDSVVAGMFVEASGFYDENGVLRASYIESKDDVDFEPGVTEVEAKGTVTGYTGGDDFDLEISTVSSIAVVNVLLAEIDDSVGTLADGLFVEVKGTLNATGDTINATKIEREGFGDADDDRDMEVEGIVSGFAGLGNTFLVANVTVDASSVPDAGFEPASLRGTIDNGFEVEVEGHYVGGVLVADVIKARGGDIEIEATIEGINVSLQTVTVGPLGINDDFLTVVVDSSTRFEDGADGPLVTPPFSLDDMMAGDFVEIEVFDDEGVLRATRVKRDEEDDFILQGPTDAAPATLNPNVSILGVEFNTAGLTDFENEFDVPISPEAFFAEAEPGGRLVKVKDRNRLPDEPADGIADEAELEN